MTELAILRKAGRHMIRAGGGLVVLQMAGGARRVESRILAVRMTLLARNCGMRSRKREFGSAVIKCRSQPLRSGVTKLAVLRLDRT